MCSMVLLHSCVAKAVYLIPMDKTGGCGGAACLPRLEGANHRFEVEREVSGGLESMREVGKGWKLGTLWMFDF